MDSRYDEYSELVTENAKDPTIVASNMELIRPLFEMAEKGEFQFGNAEDLDLDEAATAISLAIGKPITKIILVSKSNPFPKPDWMSEAEYIKTLANLMDNLRHRLWDSLEQSHRDSLSDHRLRGSLMNIFKDSFWKSLRDSIKPSIWDSRALDHGYSLVHNIRDNLRKSLFIFLSFVLLNDLNKIEQLRPLIRCLSSGYIPIAFKADEPGAYLVMVA